AQFLKTSAPSSLEGIEKYLASGMIRGIGPVYAKRLLGAFGDEVFDVIEAEPDRLRAVNGIGAVRASRIVAAWAEQKVVSEIMVFLHSHGVGTARAVRIFKTYGAEARAGLVGKSIPPGPRHSWHWLQDSRRDCHEAGYRKIGDDPSSRWDLLRPDRGHGR